MKEFKFEKKGVTLTLKIKSKHDMTLCWPYAPEGKPVNYALRRRVDFITTNWEGFQVCHDDGSVAFTAKEIHPPKEFCNDVNSYLNELDRKRTKGPINY